MFYGQKVTKSEFSIILNVDTGLEWHGRRLDWWLGCECWVSGLDGSLCNSWISGLCEHIYMKQLTLTVEDDLLLHHVCWLQGHQKMALW